jgi:type II secretory pathway pseudopilin PulG
MKKLIQSLVTKKHLAFSLIEVLGILAVMAIFIGIMTYPMLGVIEQGRLREERAKMDLIAREIESSFFQVNYGKNVSAIDGLVQGTPLDNGDIPHWDVTDSGGNVGPYILPTAFETGYYPSGTVDKISEQAWYYKIALLRGITPTLAVAPDSIDGAFHELLFNIYNNQRILICGPQGEPDGQRYLLLSFLFPPSQAQELKLKLLNAGASGAGTYAEWVNNLYNYEWSRVGSEEIPPWSYTSGSPVEGKGWLNVTSSKLTYAERVVAKRIIQRRFHVRVNNLTSGESVDVVDIRANINAVREFGPVAANGDPAGLGVARQLYPCSAANFVLEPTLTGQSFIFPPPYNGNEANPRLGILTGRRVVVFDSKTNLQISFQIDMDQTVTFQNGKASSSGTGGGS